MLTRAFYVLLGNDRGMLLDNIPSTLKNVQGDIIPSDSSYISLGDGQYSTCFAAEPWKSAKIVIGSGTTKPKNTDYKLEAEITEGYDCSSLTKRYIQGEEKDYLNIYGMVTNTGTTDLTFSEVALLIFVKVNDGMHILIAREVYDTPITIKPGKSVAVNINIL